MLEWWFFAYHWLEANNLWKAAVGWTVGLALNSVWAIRLWVKQKAESRARHEQLKDMLDVNTPGGIAELADRLDVRTPGGIADLARILQGKELEDLEGDTDDNGTDYPDEASPAARRRRKGGSHGDKAHDGQPSGHFPIHNADTIKGGGIPGADHH